MLQDCSLCIEGYYHSAAGQCVRHAPLYCHSDYADDSKQESKDEQCNTSLDTRDACHNRGNCTVHGTCSCDDGFYGNLCQLSVCPNSWTDAECTCCPSGVLSATGACCDMVNGMVPLLDKDGNCCNMEWLDALGTCGGNCTNIDRHGRCCEVCGLNGIDASLLLLRSHGVGNGSHLLRCSLCGTSWLTAMLKLDGTQVGK